MFTFPEQFVSFIFKNFFLFCFFRGNDQAHAYKKLSQLQASLDRELDILTFAEISKHSFEYQ